MNEKIPVEVILNIITKTSPDNLYKICSQNKHYSEICKNNFNFIAKYYLDKYEVNYTDPGNFIYKYHKTGINNFKDWETCKWNYPGLFRLYMKMFNESIIDCMNKNMNITSFPIYPNMIEFYGENNKLTSFPTQPKMVKFYGRDNKLTSFPIQPKMELFSGNNNQLTSFPIQPKLERFYAENNPVILNPFPRDNSDDEDSNENED